MTQYSETFWRGALPRCVRRRGRGRVEFRFLAPVYFRASGGFEGVFVRVVRVTVRPVP